MTRSLSHTVLKEAAAPPPCEICGHTGAAFLRSLRFEGYPGTFDLWQCRSCDQVWNWPQLPPQAIERQYDGGYYVFASPPARRWSRAVQLYMNHLHPLEHDKGSLRLLEIGCARGELLALARARGWDVQGIEISADAAESARNEYGLPVQTGTLEESTDRIDRFDVLIATDVIEHVASPQRFASAARRVLRPDGIAIIETPNWDSIWRRLGGSAWLGLNRFHLHLFNSRSLTTLMRRCGFAACRAATTTHFAYSRWGNRPELMRWAHGLPAAFRWRSVKWLNSLTPRSSAVELEMNPVASLDEAVHRVATAGSCPEGWHPSRQLTGDNLVVCAEADLQPKSSGATESTDRECSFEF